MFKRYKPFFRAGAIDLLAYKFNLFTWLIVSILEVACIVFLWFGVYQSSVDGMDTIINGFSFKEMICYVVMINIYNFVSFDGTTLWTIDDEIKNGTIAMSFVKPISYRARFIATTLGSVSMKILMLGIPLFTISYLIFGLVGFITITSVGSFLLYLLLFVISQFIAILLTDTINYIFGVLCFYTTSSWGLNQLKEVILQFLSGSLIPIAFFPGVFKTIATYLPFAGIAQNPVLILLMKLSYIDALKFIGVSLLWLILLELFAKWLFYTASKKVTVQGG